METRPAAPKALRWFYGLDLWPRLVIAVTIGFAALFGLFSLLSLRAVNDSTRRILEERLVISRMAAGEIDRLLDRAFYELDKATEFAAFDPLAPSLSEEVHLLAHVYGRTGTFTAGVYFLAADGKVVVSQPPDKLPRGTDLSAAPHIQRVLVSHRRVVSDPFIDPASGKPVVALTVPIVNHDGTLRGMLSGQIDTSAQDILGPLKHAIDIGHTGHAELVDSSGRIIASTESGGFLQPGEHLDFYLRALRQSGARVEKVLYTPWHSSPEGHKTEHHIMSFAPLSVASWGVAVGGVDWETLSPVTRLRNTLLLGGGLSLAFLWVLTLLGARLMVRPVLGLTQAARRMAAGDLDRPVEVVEGGEIGTLGDSLEVMRVRQKAALEQMRHWGEDLEAKVQERTADLASTNRRLAAVTAVATAANEASSQEAMLERCLEVVLGHTGMEAGVVRLVDPKTGRLAVAASGGSYPSLPCHEEAVGMDECPCGLVASKGTPTFLDPRGRKERLPACRAPGAHAVAILPLKSPKNTAGVLFLSRGSGELPGNEERETLAAICQQIAVAIENARLVEEVHRLQAQREVERMKAEFISAVSHELRTPLGFIKGYASTLLRRDISVDPPTQREFLQIIDEEAARLQTMIEELLDASRIQAGRLPLDRKPVVLATLVQRAVGKVKPAAVGTRRSMAVELPAEELTVLADPGRIEQVLDNLLDNARLYSGPETAIRVAVSRNGHVAVVSVADQGDGVPESEREQVFEPFFRGSSARRHEVRGTGLGLAICRGIVEAHGGRIWVESGVQQGSTFFFTVPLASHVSAPQPGADTAGSETEKGPS